MLNVISGLLSGAGAPASTTSYESIATVTVSGGASTIDFTSIPSTFKHLQIRGIGNATNNDIRMQFNGDTGTNYSLHFVYGDGTSAVAGATASSSYMAAFYVSGSANVYGAGLFDILDYQNTNKNKTVRGLTGYDGNGSGLLVFRSGAWYSTAAITSIKLYPASGTIQNASQFALYGIKG